MIQKVTTSSSGSTKSILERLTHSVRLPVSRVNELVISVSSFILFCFSLTTTAFLFFLFNFQFLPNVSGLQSDLAADRRRGVGVVRNKSMATLQEIPAAFEAKLDGSSRSIPGGSSATQ